MLECQEVYVTGSQSGELWRWTERRREFGGVRFKAHFKGLLWSRAGRIGWLRNVQQKVTSGRRDVERCVGVCRARRDCVNVEHVRVELDFQ